MKKIALFSISVLWMFPFVLMAQNKASVQDAQKAITKANSACFIENRGQWPVEVLFLARTGGMNAWITSHGVVYDYYKNSGMNGHVVSITMKDALHHPGVITSGQQKAYLNYIRSGIKGSIHHVKQYNELLICNAYPGINIRYYFEQGLLRYDYIVQSGADPSVIKLEIAGSDGYRVNSSGELTINTTLGAVVHGKLFAYQQKNNKQTKVECSFEKNSSGSVGLKLEAYDPAYALVIDPLVFSTFIGGSGEEYCTALTLDNYGNSYITGYTRSTDFPVSFGAYDTSSNLGSDVFVAKIDEPGSSLIFSTYISADSNEAGNSIALDSNDNIYITGYTQSSNYPVTAGAYDETYNGGSNFGGDAFITKLDATGSFVLYSTFLGGVSNDYGSSVVVDPNGYAYITGYSKSPDYPTTTGAYSQTLNGSLTDMIVSKIDPTGSALIYSTFIGGTADETGNAIMIDATGNAYLTGYTSSADFITTLGAYDRSFNGGSQDAFVVKLNAAGSALAFSTFLGGTSFDIGSSLKIFQPDVVFIAGYTMSADFPVTTGAWDESHNGGWDAFVCKLNTVAGMSPAYATFIGGKDDDMANALDVDDKGNAFIAGKTSSSNYPFIPGAFDITYNGGSTFGTDGFLTQLNTTGKSLIYSTFFGGTDEDYCTALKLDAIGTAFFAGNTMSANFPATSAALDVTQNGDYDAFVSCIFFPVKQATALTFKNITGSKASVSFTKGTGFKRAVFMKPDSWGTVKPETDQTYTANDTFGLGSQVGSTGWYCVYNDTGSAFTVYGLSQLTTYRLMVCEYLGLPGNEHYNTDSVNKNPAGFTTIYATPTLQASGISVSNLTDTSFTMSFTKGNGPKRVVFVKLTTTGYPAPVNNITYNAKPLYGQGSQIGLTGWYCVYNDTGNTVTIRKLQPGKTYRVMVCEYNGSPGKEQYLTDTAPANPVNQLISYLKPSKQASSIVFTQITKTSVNFGYTRGNGLACLVLITNGDTPVPPLVNGTTYSVNSVIGTSGWVVKYKGSLSAYSIGGLNQDTFRLMVCEYNGIAGFEVYNTDTATSNPKTFTTVLVGVDDLQKEEIHIYPNPSNGRFVIENAKGCSVKIFNTLGEEIYKTMVNEDDFAINLFDQKDGIYFVRLEKEGTLISKKLILKR